MLQKAFSNSAPSVWNSLSYCLLLKQAGRQCNMHPALCHYYDIIGSRDPWALSYIYYEISYTMYI